MISENRRVKLEKESADLLEKLTAEMSRLEELSAAIRDSGDEAAQSLLAEIEPHLAVMKSSISEIKGRAS